MKHLFFLLIASFTTQFAIGQTSKENRNLEFDLIDLKIIQKADSILDDTSKWNKLDDRKCDDDIASGKYSLFCSLYKGSIDLTGEYIHRRSAMQIVRFTLEKFEIGRIVNHRLMDWNNHPDTTFEEVKQVLKESMDEVSRQLEKSSKK